MMDNSGILEKLRNTTIPKKTSFLRQLEHLIPGRLCFMLKYLILDEEDPIQFLSNYFEIALHFTALGVLIRKTNDGKDMSKSDKRWKRMAFDSMLRTAMKRLRDSALRAHSIEEKFKEIEIAHGTLLQKKEKLEAERLGLLETLKEAILKIKELMNVQLAVPDTKEQLAEAQTCDDEKLLMLEIDTLGKAIEMFSAETKLVCKDCETKERLIADLREQLQEREFFMMASGEEVKVAQDEKNELSAQLAIADIIAGDLERESAREVEQHKLDQQKHEATIAQIMAEKQAADLLTEKLRKELKLLQAVSLEQKSCDDSVVEIFSSKQAKLEDEVLEAAMQRGNVDLVKVRNKMSNAQGNRIKSLDSRVKEILEIENLHVDEYEKQVDALQNELKQSEQKVAELEERAFHPPYGEFGLLIRDKGEISGSNCENLLRSDSMGPEIGCRELLPSTSKQLLVSYVDKRGIDEQEVHTWKNLYFAAKRTVEILEKDLSNTGALSEKVNINLQKLAEWHFKEIVAFERQMRARDERIEAFRKHLMLMELKSQILQMEIEHLSDMLLKAQDEIKKLQRGKGIALSTLTEEPYYLDSQNELITTNGRSNINEIVTTVREIYPQAKEVMPGLSLGSYSAGRSLENFSTLNREIIIRNAVDIACLEVDKLLQTIAEAKEQLDQPDMWSADHWRDLVDHSTRVARLGEMLKKLKSLFPSTRETQIEHYFQRGKAGYSSGKELQKLEREHERETKADRTFRRVSWAKGAWEKKPPSPVYNPTGEKGNKMMTHPSIRSLQNRMVQDDGRAFGESRQMSTYARKLNRRHSSEIVQNPPLKPNRRHSSVSLQNASSESMQNMQQSKCVKTKVEAPNRLEMLKLQIFG